MFCPKCGNPCRDGSKFCVKCGAPLPSMASEATVPKTGTDKDGTKAELQTGGADMDAAKGEPHEPQTSDSAGGKSGKRRKGILAAVIIVILAAAAAFAAYFFLSGGGKEKQYEQHMEAGRTYLEEESFDEAVAEFEEAIAIDENVVEPYQLMAQAYIGLEDDEHADETYDTVRGLIVTTYEDSNGEEILADAKEVYLEAAVYYDEQGNTEKADEVLSEISEILPDDAEIQEAVSERKAQEEEDAKEDDSGTESSDEDAAQLSEESVREMLSTFDHYAYEERLYDWYSDSSDLSYNADILDYEVISADQAYTLAAWALIESGEAYVSDEIHYDIGNGTLKTWEEMSEAEKNTASGTYSLIDSALYQSYLTDLFGADYSLDDFTEISGDSAYRVIVRNDTDGNFYALVGDFGEETVEVSIESISDSTDEDGAYTVLARYDISMFDEGHIETYYMRYQIRPDTSSSYGCVILGMTPAGLNSLEE